MSSMLFNWNESNIGNCVYVVHKLRIKSYKKNYLKRNKQNGAKRNGQRREEKKTLGKSVDIHFPI